MTSTFIIGGGPSAQEFDFSVIGNHQVILVNGHYHFCVKTAAALFSLDRKWILRSRDFITSWKGPKFLATPVMEWLNPPIPGVAYLKTDSAKGLSDDPNTVRGNNSGHAALNLAVHQGAKQIYLVGFDMDSTVDSHEHEFPYWIDDFRKTVPFLEAKGISVINLNKNSTIDAFPRLTVQEAGIGRLAILGCVAVDSPMKYTFSTSPDCPAVA